MIRTAFVSVVVLLWATPNPLAAQIDYRVDYHMGSSGRDFDANNRIGSGGANPRSWSNSPYNYSYGVYANQVVAGNVSGLGGFHGQSVVPGVNQFRIGLQSDSLAGFRAQSVNIAQVRNGTAPRSTSYYDPSTSIADAGAIRVGLNQPGSSFLSSPQVRLPTYAEQRTRDQLLGIDRYPTPAAASSLDAGYVGIGGITQRQIAPTGQAGGDIASSLASDPYRSAMQSTLFGTPQVEPEPSYAPSRSPQDRPVDGRFSTELSRNELLGLVDKRANIPSGVAEPESRDGVSTMSAPFNSLVDEFGRSDRAVIPQSDGDASAQDELYGRMIDAVRQMQSAGSLDGFMARQSQDGNSDRDPLSGLLIGSKRQNEMNRPETDVIQSPADMPAEQAATSGMEGSSREETPQSLDVDPKTAWADRFMRTPIRSFSLGGPSRVAQYMRSAEEALRKGDFNKAAALFDLAATVDPENPIPLLGRANAQIAAGQYVSAVISLEAGLRLFPEIAAFELDLPTLTGQADIYDRRRADLESILERREQFELRFLLGYIELYSGLHDDGMNDLDAAARNAPAGSVIAAFPDMLLGRKPLDARVP